MIHRCQRTKETIHCRNLLTEDKCLHKKMDYNHEATVNEMKVHRYDHSIDFGKN